MLRRLVPEGYMVESFTYTQADFAKARQEILGYIREHGIDLVVGSSLGGFIALTLSGIPRIVVLIYGESFAFFLHLHLHLQKKSYRTSGPPWRKGI